MALAGFSLRRPVFSVVVSLILIVGGLFALYRLPLREFPDADPPVVTVETRWPGAAAAIVETRLTKLLEDQISGLEALKTISSSSQDGQSRIVLEFEADRDADAAASDVRDRVSRVLSRLPEEAESPEVIKTDSDTQVILWLNLRSETMNLLELTDYARRRVVDRIASQPGVALVRLAGEKRYAVRVWLDRRSLAARNLAVNDVERALRNENVDSPAGRLESSQRDFSLRIERSYKTPEDFARLTIGRGEDGRFIRLGEVAKIEIDAAELRGEFRSNGQNVVGIGVAQQAKGNTLAAAKAVKAEMERIRPTLPEGTQLVVNFDASVFIEEAIHEVLKTLVESGLLVVLVIYCFLGSIRATLVPATTVVASLAATFLAMYAFGHSVNLITLLALVLAVGLVVDDAVVVVENIFRRVEQGEPPLLAADRGMRQLEFAIMATTLVLVAVFAPVAFLRGSIGRLFTEFAVAVSAAVWFSTLIALTLAPVMGAKLIRKSSTKSFVSRFTDRAFQLAESAYTTLVHACLNRPAWVIATALFTSGAGLLLFHATQREFAPTEDRSSFFVFMTAPEGSGFDYAKRHMRRIEAELLPLVDSGEAIRILSRTPRDFTILGDVNSGLAICTLSPIRERKRSTQAIARETFGKLQAIPGVRAVTVLRQGLRQFTAGRPVQFVLTGDDYGVLAEARNRLLAEAAKNPGLQGPDSDYRETKPQMRVVLDSGRAATLGVSAADVGRTLETAFGSRDVTNWLMRDEEYDVILQARLEDRLSPDDLKFIRLRTADGGLAPLADLVRLVETSGPQSLNRLDRMKAITIDAGLAPGYSLGQALDFLNAKAKEVAGPNVRVAYRGESREFMETSAELWILFGLAVLATYLVLAAQFESFIHPLVVMTTAPLGLAGAVFGLYASGLTMNIFSQVGMIMLVGLASKNSILIVEFANQLRDEGLAFRDALVRASRERLRPIVMTGLASSLGAAPLFFSVGAGAESRKAIGAVILFGGLVSTVLTLFCIPVFYDLFCRGTRSPEETARELEALERAAGPQADA